MLGSVNPACGTLHEKGQLVSEANETCQRREARHATVEARPIIAAITTKPADGTSAGITKTDPIWVPATKSMSTTHQRKSSLTQLPQNLNTAGKMTHCSKI